MAREALTGLKLLDLFPVTVLAEGQNGQGSPVGIETAHTLVAMIARSRWQNGQGGPVGIETHQPLFSHQPLGQG